MLQTKRPLGFLMELVESGIYEGSNLPSGKGQRVVRRILAIRARWERAARQEF